MGGFVMLNVHYLVHRDWVDGKTALFGINLGDVLVEDVVDQDVTFLF